MPTYKLYYFQVKGRAELTRLIFAQAGVQFEDIRFTGEEWAAEYKKKSPFGVCPWLEVDGKQIGGSTNIARFVGESVGLAGSNEIENAQIAAIADSFNDCGKEALKPVFMKDDDPEKEKLKEKFVNDCPKWFDIYERMITPSGYLFGDKLTWVDIAAARAITFMTGVYPDLLSKYPKVAALVTKVNEQPNIAKWIKEHPEREF